MKNPVITLAVAIALIGVIIVLAWWLRPPGIVLQMSSMKKEIELTIGEEKLRTWSKGLLEQHRAALGDDESVLLPTSAVPDWLTSLGHPFAFTGASVWRGKGESDHVRIGWVTGRGGVILAIGETNYTGSDFGAEFHVVDVYPGVFLLAGRN
jgi:hypothetical protein